MGGHADVVAARCQVKLCNFELNSQALTGLCASKHGRQSQMECVSAKNVIAQSVFDHEAHGERGHGFRNLHIDCQNH